MNVSKRHTVYYDVDGNVVHIGDSVSGIEVTSDNLEALEDSGAISPVYKYEDISFFDVVSDIPSLGAFYSAYEIADDVMKGIKMPAASSQFNDVINALDDAGVSSDRLTDIVMNNEDLLSSLSDFFQSYILLQSGAVDETKLSYYINKFASDFITRDVKAQYPHNPLIQAIQYATSKDASGKESFVLKLETTGMEQSEKDELSAGWVQLERENSGLSHMLFFYNFFRTGIGFSPKSFMGLVPIQVKENVDKYVDTYRNMPSVDARNVVDLWIRNNWDDGALVPRMKELPSGVSLQETNGTLELYVDSSNYAQFANKRFFKTRIDGKDTLFQRTNASDETKTAIYREVTPLGNNGEYFEASTKPNYVAMKAPARSNKESATRETGNSGEVAPSSKGETDERQVRRLEAYLKAVIPSEDRKALAADKPKLRNIMVDTASKLGLSINDSKFDELVESFC